MKSNRIFVFDTNTIVSAFLLEGSTSAKAFDKAKETGRIVFSDTSLAELEDVLLC